MDSSDSFADGEGWLDSSDHPGHFWTRPRVLRRRRGEMQVLLDSSDGSCKARSGVVDAGLVRRIPRLTTSEQLVKRTRQQNLRQTQLSTRTWRLLDMSDTSEFTVVCWTRPTTSAFSRWCYRWTRSIVLPTARVGWTRPTIPGTFGHVRESLGEGEENASDVGHVRRILQGEVGSG